MDRRRYLTAAGAASASVMAGCTGGGGGTPTPRVERETVVRERTVVQERTVVRTQSEEDLTPMHTVTLEGAFNTIPYLYGASQGAWRQNGIDLSIEIAPFGKFQRQVVTDISKVGSMSVPAAIDFPLKGEPLTWVGQEINFTNYMMTLNGSGIEEPPDIEGRSLGIPFETSSTTNGYVAMMYDAYDLDIFEAPSEVRSAAPPVLWNLLIDGELDAVIEFAGFSISGEINENVNVIFNPIEYWQNEYGTLPPLTIRATMMPWLQDNAGLALQFQQGWADALTMFRENVDEALQNYGRVAGLTEPEAVDIVRERVENELQFGPTEYTQEVADSNWRFGELMRDAGVFDSLPDKADVLTTSTELEELAGD